VVHTDDFGLGKKKQEAMTEDVFCKQIKGLKKLPGLKY